MAEIRETHTHTTTDTGGGAGAGMILGVILTIVVLAFAAWFLLGNFRGPTTEPARPSGDTNIQINPPAPPPKVDVQVNPPAQQAPAGQNQPAPKAP
jgi:hypothetical protein